LILKLFLFTSILAACESSAHAQMSMAGARRSLGGYGAATIGQYYSSGTTAFMPYSGSGGYIPYQGGYAGGLGVIPVSRRLPQTPIGGTSMPMTPIGGGSLAGGMAGGREGMGARAGGRAFLPFGYEGSIGMEGRMVGTPMTQQGGRRPASGPGFRYPFTVPPSLLGPAVGSGPSM
jgi:hypothetical protein